MLPRMLELNTIQADDAAGLMMSVLQVESPIFNEVSTRGSSELRISEFTQNF